VGTTRSGVVGFEAAVLTLAASFFLDFQGAGLVVAVDLGLGFLGLAVFLVAVTLGCLDAPVTGREGFGGGVLVALTKRPPQT
jgi:hypothetical protein